MEAPAPPWGCSALGFVAGGWLLEGSLVPFPAGSSDRLGRALLQVTTSGSAWGATWCSASELARLVLYLCSLPR